jgi:co-chaperonin GroES (HSP10)
MSIMPMHHEVDPAEEIRNKIGDLSGINLLGPKILCAIYVRPTKTKGGIILTDKVRDEDIYQGKIGLIVKVGVNVAEDPEWFGDTTLTEGMWVGFRASDGYSLIVNGVNCRILDDVRIQCTASHPDLIW